MIFEEKVMDASLIKWQVKHSLATSQQRHLSRENYCLQLMHRVRGKKSETKMTASFRKHIVVFYVCFFFFSFLSGGGGVGVQFICRKSVQFICRKTSASIHTITLYISIIRAEKIFTLSNCWRNNMVERGGGRERDAHTRIGARTHTHTHTHISETWSNHTTG